MKYELEVGSVSWINASPNPIPYAVAAEYLVPPWIAKAFVGLAATANRKPPESIGDFNNFRNEKQFRALTYFRLAVSTDDSTRKISTVDLIDEFLDPGFTPPFNYWKYPSGPAGALIDTGWQAAKATMNRDFHPGEQSQLSAITKGNRHPNTTLTKIPADETVIADALIKFRAGPATDALGLMMGSPFHVPWVWCETLLTYKQGKFRLYGCGSCFPTHSWYFNKKNIASIAQVGDYHFPMRTPKGPPKSIGESMKDVVRGFREIDVQRLALYPVLSKGAPATPGSQAQTGVDPLQNGPVQNHRNSVGAGNSITFSE
jgi:hypothetical protein